MTATAGPAAKQTARFVVMYDTPSDGPSGRRLQGMWVGFGRENEVNTGPWTLTRVTANTRKASLESYNRPAADKTPDGDDAV